MSAVETSKQPPSSSTKDTVLDTIVVRALMLWEEQRGLLLGTLVALVLAALAAPGYIYYMEQQAAEAQEKLGNILPVYEQGQYQAALDGTGDRPSLASIVDDYGSTAAGNMAAFYAGNAAYELENYDQALQYYEQFEKEEDYFGASAYAAMAAIYENRGEFAQAADYYVQAAEHFESDFSTPRYLFNAGRAYEEAGQFDDATRLYQRVQDEYPDAQQATQAARYLARVEARQTAS